MKLDRKSKIMKFFVICVGAAIPFAVGYWRYVTNSEPTLSDAIGWGFLSALFSSGLWLGVTQFGKRFRYLSLALIVLCSLVHIVFVVYPLFFLPLLLIANSYAIYSLFCNGAK